MSVTVTPLGVLGCMCQLVLVVSAQAHLKHKEDFLKVVTVSIEPRRYRFETYTFNHSTTFYFLNCLAKIWLI